jgi:transcriptional regulator GlxA family with amidase domain
LHLIPREYGAAVAAHAARLAVMPLERAGGQAQFIVHAEPSPEGSTIEPLLRWLEQHAHHDLS